MKYPIGMQSFDQIREMGFVYVDKTDMVYRLATEGKIYFLSRPPAVRQEPLSLHVEALFLRS